MLLITNTHNEVTVWRAYQELYGTTSSVTEVEAEGAELELILEHIKGIPYSDSDRQRWFGSDAKFIVAYFRRQVWKSQQVDKIRENSK